ncbi:hypothetical protein C7T36_12230 [Rhodococcus sp. AD45-ID]|uniref:hypothetical protein n=1 Tax=unclassified Rhodococcus (in: high G+C Gram-positive bacteria) TaxID=192944 RepID=UPI0005D2DF15|nr:MULTISPECIES: hypothetical protein [unclassified Rhodococcus (in: high G+C Gram-positive bacteria)]PSR42869.1 hypothetical protein C7T36_12230 [Rhodococcus sp. AD45-ID]
MTLVGTLHLVVDSSDSEVGARIGGHPPQVFDGQPILQTHEYLLTLAAHTAPWLGDRELSVFVRRGFSIGDDDLEYPGIGVRAVLHPPSARSAASAGRHSGLGSAALIQVPADDEVMPLVLIAPQPVLIQNEPSYADAVEADGHRFLFQINEEGWPVVAEPQSEFVEEYLFGYGSVYFYGSADATGLANEVVPGFLDF